MKYWLSVLVLALLAVTGCGESEQSKKNRTTSQVNVLADKLSQQVGEDGWFIQAKDITELDAWGNKLNVKYTRFKAWGSHCEKLVVYSNGPDGLPLTKDDIGATFILDNETFKQALADAKKKEWDAGRPDRQASVEGYSAALTKGLTKGVFDAWKNRNK